MFAGQTFYEKCGLNSYMTRRGSLVYYLTSWICGGFFLTIAMFLQERARPEEMGSSPERRRRGNPYHVFSRPDFWCVSFGSVRVPAAANHGLASCGKTVGVGRRGSCPGSAADVGHPARPCAATDAMALQGLTRQLAVVLFLGVRGIAERHALLGLPVAALTASVLFLIHRAFSQKAEE